MPITCILLAKAVMPIQTGPYLSWKNDPRTTMVVSWNTTAPETTLLAWGTTSECPDTTRGAYEWRHEVELTGLAPGTLYYYSIPAHPEYGLCSFTTGQDKPDSIVFLVFGDTRNNPHLSLLENWELHRDIVRAIIQGGPYEFGIHTGDIALSGSTDSHWQWYFATVADLVRTTPILYVPGNHEEDAFPDLLGDIEHYTTLLALPGNEANYSWDYGFIHFVALSTTGRPDSLEKVTKWLEDDLARAKKNKATKWIIAYFHEPFYSSGDHGGSRDFADYWEPVMSKYGVRLALCGHDHDYERTKPIKGIVYMVVGGGGATPYPIKTHNDWSVVAETTYHYVRIVATPTKLVVTGFRIDGSVLDSFTVKR